MPITYFPLNVDVSQVVGFPVKVARLEVSTSLPKGTVLAYGAAGQIAVPGGIYNLAGGIGSLTLPTKTGLTNVSDYQYVITGEYSLDGVRPVKMDPIYIDAPTSTDAVNLASFIGVTSAPPTFMGQAVAQLQAKVDEAEAIKAYVTDVSNIDTTVSAVDFALGQPGPAATLNAAYVGKPSSDMGDWALLRRDTSDVTRGVAWTTPVEMVARALGWVFVTDPQFGADRTGVASSVPAVEAVIDYANTRGNITIYFPPGTYNLRAGITKTITRNYVEIVGAGPGVTRLSVKSGTLFDWSNSAVGGGFTHADFYCSDAAPDTTQRVIRINGASSQKFERIFTDNVCQLARLGEPVGSGGQCSAPSFRHIYGNTAAIAGAVVIDAVRGFSLSMTDVVVNSRNVGFPTGREELHPAPAGTTFLRFGLGSWDTAHLHEVTTNRYDYGLDVNVTSAAVVSNMWFYGCVFDYGKTRGIRLRTAGVGAYIGSLMFIGGWAVATDGYSVEVVTTTSGGLIENIDFTNVTAQQAGKSNWRFSSSSYPLVAVRLLNCRSSSGNRLLGNSFYDAVDLAILADGVTVTGGRFGDPVSGGAYQPAYGVGVDANRNVRITGALGAGELGGWTLATNTAADARSLVTDNRVVSPTGRPEYTSATGAVAVPGSGSVQTQTRHTRDVLHIFGGTVSSIKHNTIEIGTTGPASITLSSGDTWSVSYSVAPTIRRMVQA